LTAELQKKEEEMKQMFVVRVKEKESELKDAEKAVCLYYIPSFKI
jgi:septin 6/8/11